MFFMIIFVLARPGVRGAFGTVCMSVWKVIIWCEINFVVWTVVAQHNYVSQVEFCLLFSFFCCCCCTFDYFYFYIIDIMIFYFYLILSFYFYFYLFIFFFVCVCVCVGCLGCGAMAMSKESMCAFCGGVIRSWEQGMNDEPKVERTDYGREERPVWQPDASASKCTKCGTVFGMFSSRHHCRNCGHVVCESCSKHRATIEKFNYKEPVRVCDSCWPSFNSPQNDPW
jgi:hypothetical protein